MASFPLVSATGMLGSGYRAESLDKAIELGARMIGCDAGSTDPGPGPLATGTCMFSKAAVKRDTEIMVSRAVAAGIPLVIGSCGQGSDAGLGWMRDTCARSRARPPFQAGGDPPESRRRPCASICAGERRRCHHRRRSPRGISTRPACRDDGVEPIQAAVAPGRKSSSWRSSDTSVFAALPLPRALPRQWSAQPESSNAAPPRSPPPRPRQHDGVVMTAFGVAAARVTAAARRASPRTHSTRTPTRSICASRRAPSIPGRRATSRSRIPRCVYRARVSRRPANTP